MWYKLTDEELRKVRLEGDAASGLKGVRWLAVLLALGLVVAAIIIQVNGG